MRPAQDAPPAGSPLAGRRVAIVEDDLTTAIVADRICRRLGARETVHCSDRAQAAAVLGDEARSVDVVLLDMMLGADDGLAALRNLDAQAVTAEIVPVSANDPRVLDAAVRLLAGRGFRVHAPIVKPLTAEKLDRALRGTVADATQALPPLAQPGAQDLADAIDADEFVPFYQLKSDASSLAPYGVEVLARWRKPGVGLLGPGFFIPGLEETGLVGAFTERLLARATYEIGTLARAGHPLCLALNVSPPSLADPVLPDRFQAIVTGAGLTPSQVTFEMTECAVLRDPLALLEATARLRLHGFKLAIDDFGTGWSSLDQLRTLPFTELKIDRSFVAGAPDDPQRQVILRSVVAIAHGFGLGVVAEGVETEAERLLLDRLGVEAIQGWMTSRPLDASALAATLASLARDGRAARPLDRDRGQ